MNANEKNTSRLNRIKKVIKVVRYLVSISIILLVVCGSLFLADLAGFGVISDGVKISFSPLLTYQAPFKIPTIVLILAFLRCGLWLVGALILFWWLDLVEAGEFFTAQCVRHIRLLGVLVLSDWVLTKVLDAMSHSGHRIYLRPTRAWVAHYFDCLGYGRRPEDSRGTGVDGLNPNDAGGTMNVELKPSRPFHPSSFFIHPFL